MTQLFINILQILGTNPNNKLVKGFCKPKIKQTVSKLAAVNYRNDVISMTKPHKIL